MKTKIQKWGNSLGLRIPKSFAEEAALGEGTAVDISVKNGKLIVKPLRPNAYALQDLLTQVTKHNIHREVSSGQHEGKEAW